MAKRLIRLEADGVIYEDTRYDLVAINNESLPHLLLRRRFTGPTPALLELAQREGSVNVTLFDDEHGQVPRALYIGGDIIYFIGCPIDEPNGCVSETIKVCHGRLEVLVDE